VQSLISPTYLIQEETAYLEGADASSVSLADCFATLVAAWTRGVRDREVALHLMFIASHGLVEPTFITGFGKPESKLAPEEASVLRHVFAETTHYLMDAWPGDPEILFVLGITFRMFGAVLRDEHLLLARENIERSYSHADCPDPAIFRTRGGYGRYYGAQARTFGSVD
jgi:hypothetical protein